MANTGLSEAFELVYAGNTLPHLFSGKAIDRAWRAHQLVDISLNTLLLKDSIENNEINVDILQNMIKDALNGTLDICAIKSNPVLQVVNEKLEQKKEMMKENRTSNVDARKMVVCILTVPVEDTVCLVLLRVRSVTE